MKKILLITMLLINSLLYANELDSLLKWSAENHPELKSAYKLYEASLEQVHGSGFLPEPMFSFGYFISSPETRVGPQNTSVGLQQMFPWRGTLKAQKSMAVAASKMRFEEFQLVKIQLFKQVKEIYYSAEKMKVNAALLSANIRLMERIKQFSLTNIEAGMASSTDVLRLDLKIEEMQNKKTKMLIQLEGKIKQLELLSGNPNLSLSFENVQVPVYSGLDSVSVHPMVQMNKEKLAMNEAQQVMIQQQKLPKLSLGANYIFVGKRTDMNPAYNGKDIFMPKISLTLPIYRKKYNALAKMNALEKEGIAQKVETVQLDLNTKLVMVKSKIKAAEEDLIFYKKQVKTTESILTLLNSDYENGTANIESILSTQAQLVQYQINQQNAETELKIAITKLKFLINDL